MSTLVVVGAQWGDEGKGKIVDVLTEDAHVVARFQGGHNAGHTVVINNEKYVLHIIPSGILHKEKLSIIGNGTVVEPSAMLAEIDGLREKGIEIGANLLLSRGSHLIMPYHIALDKANEDRRGKAKIGTTGRGIGPAYVDKMARLGIKAGDLLTPKQFKSKLEAAIDGANNTLKKIYNKEGFETSEVFDQYMKYAERLKPHLADTNVIINKSIDKGDNVLCEGAQGTLLDIDHGTYPFVTSSSASAGGVCTGLGIGPTKIDKVLGIVKAYATRVGEGPFPTELNDKTGEGLRERGGEYGATTGRPRRCGWLDMVALRYAARVNGLTGLVITKLDILDAVEEINICTAYKLGGETITEFPSEVSALKDCKPIFDKCRGWKKQTTGVTSIDALPVEAIKYLHTIEKLSGVPIRMVSTGAKRNEYIMLDKMFQMG